MFKMLLIHTFSVSSLQLLLLLIHTFSVLSLQWKDAVVAKTTLVCLEGNVLWAGTLLRMSGGRLPKRIMFGNLEGAVRRGRGGREKEWTDCVQSDIRAFGITGDWETMAVKAEVWVEAVTKGGRRFMAAWREEEEDAARHRQEKREATRLGKLQSHTEA